jgi:iron complex transport system substrate-binding protein
VAADDIERDTRLLLPLTYLAAKPGIRLLPSMGNKEGLPDPAQINGLNPRPDLIIIMSDSAISVEDLQKATGIPVIILHEGDLGYGRTTMNYALRVMGVVLGKSSRAEEVIGFFDKITENLQSRTYTTPDFQQRSGYIGGYSTPDPQGIYSTTGQYLPLTLIKSRNVAEEYANLNNLSGSFTIPKEALSRMTPDAIFIDMMTWRRVDSAVSDLEKTDILEGIPAVRQGEVYGLLPTSLYGEEHESELIDAYIIGKVLYPSKFTDVDPKVIADYIHSFLYGEPVFESINREYGGMVLSRIPLFTRK